MGEARKLVLEACLRLADRGFLPGTGGNFSLRIDEKRFAITPSGVDYYSMTTEDVCVANLYSLALEDGRLPQAVTEGARAGRQLNDLRDEVRKKASNRFSEDVTNMRDQARKLDEQQGRLSEHPDFPIQESAFVLNVAADGTLRRLGPREPGLAGGAVGFPVGQICRSFASILAISSPS